MTPHAAATFALRMCRAKRLYVTKKEARHSVARHLREYGTVMRIYHCPICKGYHLTSQKKGL